MAAFGKIAGDLGDPFLLLLHFAQLLGDVLDGLCRLGDLFLSPIDAPLVHDVERLDEQFQALVLSLGASGPVDVAQLLGGGKHLLVDLAVAEELVDNGDLPGKVVFRPAISHLFGGAEKGDRLIGEAFLSVNKKLNRITLGVGVHGRPGVFAQGSLGCHELLKGREQVGFVLVGELTLKSVGHSLELGRDLYLQVDRRAQRGREFPVGSAAVVIEACHGVGQFVVDKPLNYGEQIAQRLVKLDQVASQITDSDLADQ